MLVDTHCHLNFERYNEDRPQVIQRAVNAGVTRIIIPAIDLPSSHEAIQLASEYTEVFAAVGIHPNSSADFQAEVLGQIEQLAQENKVVAIGEIGLDYYWDKSPSHKQRWALESQLELAAKLELPVIIHNREASEDVIDILEAWANTVTESLRGRAGVLHSFSATIAIAERALAAGFYIGFTGPITFKKADELRNIASQIPLNRILVETDGPFLTPHPHRGKRNEPAYIPYIVEQLAQLHEISSDEMGLITTQNAEQLFKFH